MAALGAPATPMTYPQTRLAHAETFIPTAWATDGARRRGVFSSSTRFDAEHSATDGGRRRGVFSSSTRFDAEHSATDGGRRRGVFSSSTRFGAEHSLRSSLCCGARSRLRRHRASGGCLSSPTPPEADTGRLTAGAGAGGFFFLRGAARNTRGTTAGGGAGGFSFLP